MCLSKKEGSALVVRPLKNPPFLLPSKIELYVRASTPSVSSVYTLQSDQLFHLGCIAKETGIISVISLIC